MTQILDDSKFRRYTLHSRHFFRNSNIFCNVYSIQQSELTGGGNSDFISHNHNILNIYCIDINFYPTPKTKTSNSKHRPIGLGVQGLADAFMLLDLPFDSDLAKKTNREIFETIYHAAVEASMEIAKSQTPYSTFDGSPASQGKLSPDLWDKVNFAKNQNFRFDLLQYYL